MFRDLILALWSRLNRREHSHPPDQHNQPDDCNFLSKRDPPKSLKTQSPKEPGPASLCRPRFSFFSIFNCQRSDVTDATSGPSAFRLRARSSVAHAALYDFPNKAEPQRRQRRAALVGEAYIGRTQFDCQRGICKFCEFLCLPRKPRPSYDGKALIYKHYRLSFTGSILLESLRFQGFSRARRQNFCRSCDGGPARSPTAPRYPAETPLSRAQNRLY